MKRVVFHDHALRSNYRKYVIADLDRDLGKVRVIICRYL